MASRMTSTIASCLRAKSISGFGVCGAVEMVLGQRPCWKAAKRLRVWWKSGMVSMQPLAGQVHQAKLWNSPKARPASKACCGRLHRLERLRPPPRTRTCARTPRRHSDNDDWPSRVGMTISERRVMSSGVLGLELVADMRGHPHDVLHQRRRVLEDVLVDLLVDVADARAALVVGGGVGFVDMADLAGSRRGGSRRKSGTASRSAEVLFPRRP